MNSDLIKNIFSYINKIKYLIPYPNLCINIIRQKERIMTELLWIFSQFGRGHPIRKKPIIKYIQIFSTDIYCFYTTVMYHRFHDRLVYYTNYGRDLTFVAHFERTFFFSYAKCNIDNMNKLYKTKFYKAFKLLKKYSDINLILDIKYRDMYMINILKYSTITKVAKSEIIGFCIKNNILLDDIIIDSKEVKEMIYKII
jgi:hypothetical protein